MSNKKKILFALPIALCLLLPVSSKAQSVQTNVTGTVVDPNGIPYATAQIRANLTVPGATVTNNNAAQCAQGGFGSAPCKVPIQGTVGPTPLNGAGTFGMTLYRNADIQPAGTHWIFTVTISPGVAPPFGTGGQTCSVTATIAGATQSLSAALSAACPALTVPISGGGMTYPGAGVPVSTGLAWSTSKGLQGTDTNVLTSGTVAGLSATLCTDALGGATTTGCGGGGNISGTIANTQVAVGTGTDTIGGYANFTYDFSGGFLLVSNAAGTTGGLELNPSGAAGILYGSNILSIHPNAGGIARFYDAPNAGNYWSWDASTGNTTQVGTHTFRGSSTGAFALGANATAGTPAVLCGPTADPAFTGYVLAATLTASGCDSGAGTQLSYVAPSAGTPGGSDTQLQFNNSSAFGGISGWTTNGTTTLTAGATSILNLSAITGTSGFKVPINATNTAGAAGVVDYDSTLGSTHLFTGGADSIVAGFASAPAGGKCLQSSGADGVITEASGACGGGSPGGSNTQLQFNNSSAFGGISGWTTNGTTTLTAGATSILNLSAITGTSGFKVPIHATNTAGGAGVVDYDSTLGSTHLFTGGADSIVAGFASAPAGSKCLQSSGADGVITEASGACGSGGGPGTGTTDGIAYWGSPDTTLDSTTPPATKGQYYCGYTVPSTSAVAPTCPQATLQTRSVTGSTDTILYTDFGLPVEYQGSGNVAVTLPTPTSLGNTYFAVSIDNLTTGSNTNVTVTPTTFTIDGASSLVIVYGRGCRITVDPANPTTNWLALCVNFPAFLGTNVEYSNGTCTTSATIDGPNHGNIQSITLTAGDTCALTFTQPSNGTFKVQLKIIQSASASYNGTISGGKWPGGSVPTITTTSGAVDIISCYLDGSNAYCVPSQDFR